MASTTPERGKLQGPGAHLDDADRALIGARRWAHMRLGFAVQLGTVRFLGAFLDDPADVPAGVAADLARQLGIADPAGCLARYRDGERQKPGAGGLPVPG